MKQASWKVRSVVQTLCAAGVLVLAGPLLASDAALLAEVKVEGNELNQTQSPSDWTTWDSRAATKTTTPLNELAQSVSVVTQAQIEAQRPKTVVQALDYSPGAFTGLFGNAMRYDYVALRGFADTSMANTILDGMRLMSDAGSFSAFQVDPYFIERIDLVRGPMSVLYGNAAPGGMVALMSKQPQMASHNEIRVDLGTNQERSLAFDLAGGLSETLSYRLTGIGHTADSMQDFATEKRLAIMPQLLWKPNEDTALLLQAYLQNDPEGGYHSGIPYEGSVAARDGKKVSRTFFDGEPNDDSFERKQQMLAYQFAYRFSPAWELRQNFRYTHPDINLSQVYQSGWSGSDTLSRGYSFSEEELRGVAVDTRVKGSFATGAVIHDLVTGIDYQTRHNEGYWGWGSVGDINAFDPIYGQSAVSDKDKSNWVREFSQLGYYLQDQLSLDAWRLTAGIRYDQAKTTSLDTDTKKQTEWDGGKSSSRFGLLYLFDNGIAPYVSYAESFDPSSNVDQAGQVLVPTRGKQWEAGLKYQPNPSTLFTAAVYDLKQSNLARMVPGADYFEPVGTVTSKGLELESRFAISPNLHFLGAYTFNKMSISNGDPLQEGKRPRQSPEQLASAWLNYTPVHGARLGGGVRYVGKSYADIANQLEVPAVTLFDLSLSVDMGIWWSQMKGASLQVTGKNLFDKDYVASCYDENYCYFGNARSVVTSFKYVW
ncbi:TonB-dependent siderophore receptor [uncultured Deefgea sp.]|uniref:TonB-dependent siderophore receptor n=1 Tax=uncultured Deefgea sp. TaxID=1304914 RepID=UPI0026292892|nr:TonB-dependent siderophore receptor [uncultured Deefgea sp.]